MVIKKIIAIMILMQSSHKFASNELQLTMRNKPILKKNKQRTEIEDAYEKKHALVRRNNPSTLIFLNELMFGYPRIDPSRALLDKQLSDSAAWLIDAKFTAAMELLTTIAQHEINEGKLFASSYLFLDAVKDYKDWRGRTLLTKAIQDQNDSVVIYYCASNKINFKAEIEDDSDENLKIKPRSERVTLHLKATISSLFGNIAGMKK